MVRAPACHTVSDIGALGAYSQGRSVQRSSIWPVPLRDGSFGLVLRGTMPEQDDVVARSTHTKRCVFALRQLGRGICVVGTRVLQFRGDLCHC
jgi:hypothetical protein